MNKKEKNKTKHYILGKILSNLVVDENKALMLMKPSNHEFSLITNEPNFYDGFLWRYQYGIQMIYLNGKYRRDRSGFLNMLFHYDPKTEK